MQIINRVKRAALAAVLLFTATAAQAQPAVVSGETYGNTLNVGIGLNYGSYSTIVPAFNVNYEFDINSVPNLTLAPFISFYSFGGAYYRHTIVPIGVKGTYYFDDLLEASADWDFYAAGSLGFVINNISYDGGYYGPQNINRRRSAFFDAHIGAQYNFNPNIGLYLDLSTGMSTLGVAFGL